jgi:hypothetical protein
MAIGEQKGAPPQGQRRQRGREPRVVGGHEHVVAPRSQRDVHAVDPLAFVAARMPILLPEQAAENPQ